MRTRRNQTTTPTPLWAFGLVLLIGATMVGMVRLAMAANHWGPGVGDIISFGEPRPVLAPRVDFAVTRLTRAGAARCRLDSAMLARAGGSLIVEAAAPDRMAGYRVHWAGGPTSAGAADCGRDVELLVGPTALGSLATAAGGFGVGQRSMLPLIGSQPST
ncbi:MAG: hypothetical protein KGI51_08760 [Rhodospirillales bacterium]|nr:hypothetical protein [Rhodospirillales bacterium]